MAKKKWPTFRDMKRLTLIHGFHDLPEYEMEVSPTMKQIFRDGKRFFRVDGAYRMHGEEPGALYLWDGYGEESMRRKELERAGQVEQGEGRDEVHPAS